MSHYNLIWEWVLACIFFCMKCHASKKCHSFLLHCWYGRKIIKKSKRINLVDTILQTFMHQSNIWNCTVEGILFCSHKPNIISPFPEWDDNPCKVQTWIFQDSWVFWVFEVWKYPKCRFSNEFESMWFCIRSHWCCDIFFYVLICMFRVLFTFCNILPLFKARC